MRAMSGADDAPLLAAACLVTPSTSSVPLVLSSLLRSARASLLAMLVMVLPLHSVVQLVAGLQEHRHVHTGVGRTAGDRHGTLLAVLATPLRAVLDQLHAAQGPRLGGNAQGLHQHGGVFHRHNADTQDVLDVADPSDDGLQAGATLFLAWLPGGLTLAAEQGSSLPTTATRSWRDRVVPPPLAPPRA